MEYSPLENDQAKSPKPFLNKEEIILLNPGQLADYFAELTREGRLETYLDEALENPELVAQFSYWEKWLAQEERKLLDNIIAQKREIYRETQEDDDELPLGLEKRFTPEQLKLIFENLHAIQLTFGCSKGCPFCAFDAVPGAREHISYKQLERIFQNYGQSLKKNTSILYWASEPSDYLDEDKTYLDVYQLAELYAGYQPHTRSRETDKKEWVEALLGKLPKERVAISFYGINNSGKKRLFRDAEIDLVGENRSHQRGFGVSNREEKTEGEHGITQGTYPIITPRGLYNIVSLPNSERYPQGQVVVPIIDLNGAEIEIGDPIEKVLGHYLAEINDQSFSFSEDMAQKGRNERRLMATDGKKRFVVVFGRDGIIRNFREFDPNKLQDALTELSETDGTAQFSYFSQIPTARILTDIMNEMAGKKNFYSHDMDTDTRTWEIDNYGPSGTNGITIEVWPKEKAILIAPISKIGEIRKRAREIIDAEEKT
ncbi:MAG: radical SAM protein [Candidatus Paceibacterota bacterium]|jgi:hypothetical protein